MTRPTLNDRERRMFEEARARFLVIDKARREAERDGDILAPDIVGKRVLKGGLLYEITRFQGSWEGTFTARGHRILANGKRGSQEWDIGFVCEKYFDEAVALTVKTDRGL
jgi:hypothetical protein